MAATYATHMLDGLDSLYHRTDDVLKSLQEILGFFKKISELEKQYGTDLVKIAKRYASSKVCDEEIGTLRSAWDSMQQELENVGNKHCTLSDSIRKELCDSLTAYIKKKEGDQKKLVKDGQKITRDMKASIADLHTAKGKFVSASKAADSAAGAYQKAKSEGTLKPKDLHKLNSKAQKAADLAHSADKEYQKQLEKTNQKQHSYYEQELPTLLKQFQDFEEERIHFLKQQFERYATFSSQFPPFLDMSCKCLKKAVDDINVDSDTQTYLDKNKTGISAPPDIQYEPYNPANEFVTAAGPSSSSSASGPSMSNIPVSNPASFQAPMPVSGNRRDGSAPAPMPPSHGGGGGHIIETSIPVAKENEVRKDVGLSRMDPSLPPEFKLQKLRSQLKEVRESVRAERKTVKGLEKLVKFYASDPVAVEKTNAEVKDRKEKIAEMKSVMAQLESEISQLEVELGQPSGGHADYGEDDDGDEEPRHEEDWETGEIVNEHAAEEGNEEPVVIVKVRCLYPYSATNESELSFGQGDILSVTDQDDSGWWYAELNGKAGFVPKNYLEVLP